MFQFKNTILITAGINALCGNSLQAPRYYQYHAKTGQTPQYREYYETNPNASRYYQRRRTSYSPFSGRQSHEYFESGLVHPYTVPYTPYNPIEPAEPIPPIQPIDPAVSWDTMPENSSRVTFGNSGQVIYQSTTTTRPGENPIELTFPPLPRTTRSTTITRSQASIHIAAVLGLAAGLFALYHMTTGYFKKDKNAAQKTKPQNPRDTKSNLPATNRPQR